MSRQLVLASGNAGKLNEFSALLGPLGIEVLSQASLGVAPAAEPFATFVENALAKARQASRVTGLPALADDSGLCVRALQGAPGVHSARFAADAGQEPTDAANNRQLVAQMAGVTDRHASYVAVLVYLRHPDDPRPAIAEGTWDGEILSVPRGANGFGYDPHFFLPDRAVTVAELSAEAKNRYSHRARALQHLLPVLRAEAGS